MTSQPPNVLGALYKEIPFTKQPFSLVTESVSNLETSPIMTSKPPSQKSPQSRKRIPIFNIFLISSKSC